ncbi:host attachment protein [Hydrogenovibrio kuenenii]|uniref:host attachment protein n=1 Tax=Hydrogenovibrio kuenenii TaxID=63658 RepID=UPI0004671DA1|nr:host attachment protein [Hydrogenovibrio kuenenii]
MSTTIGYAILADLGNIKVFSIDKTEQKTVSLHTYQSIESVEGHAKLAELYSDKAGDFANANAGGNSSFETKSDIERTNRLIDSLSEFINTFGKQHDGKLYLSISKAIHAQVKDNLMDSTLAKTKLFLAKDLTQQNIESVLKAFEL